jgi:hypothetical protein
MGQIRSELISSQAEYSGQKSADYRVHLHNGPDFWT